MILRMSTRITGFRVGTTLEFALGYTTTLFFAKYTLPKRKPLSDIFLNYIKRKTNADS